MVEETILLEDLSQDEVDDLVEEIIDEFLEEGFSLEQIEEGFEDYISEESEVLNEANEAKKKVSWQVREKNLRKKAAKVDKSETSKAAKVVRPSDKIAASAKKAVETRKALPAKAGTSAKGHSAWC